MVIGCPRTCEAAQSASQIAVIDHNRNYAALALHHAFCREIQFIPQPAGFN
jgi:hypothetical protein